ncbi:hypothetical protein [Curtobacterium sp. 1544]|uniref:hypothetical protein n=1 Tax=Curtobacterium sp. 1544 TaxID=3156417 RepID=UPI00339856EE
MSDDVLVAFIGGAVTLGVGVLAAGVAIGVYYAGERNRRKEARQELQRQMVVRMLDTIDDAIRAGLVPRMFRLSRTPELEVVMALPRLLLDLPTQDLPVALWAASQVQQARKKLRRRAFVLRVVEIESALISWHRGDRPLTWFEEQLTLQPYDPKFTLAWWRRALLFARDALESAVAVGTLGLIGRALRAVTSR